jgi:hypothetical protein
MAEEFAEGWRQEWRDPEGARARFEVEMAELHADPMGWLRQITSTWPVFDAVIAAMTARAAAQGATFPPSGDNQAAAQAEG